MFNFFDPYETERRFYEQKLAEYYIERLKEKQNKEPDQKKKCWLRRLLNL